MLHRNGIFKKITTTFNTDVLIIIFVFDALIIITLCMSGVADSIVIPAISSWFIDTDVSGSYNTTEIGASVSWFTAIITTKKY